MNPECKTNSVYVSTRPEIPRRSLSPPEYAAAGDAHRGQTSHDSTIVAPAEFFATETPMPATVTQNDSKSECISNDLYGHPNLGQIKSSAKGPLENVASVIREDSSLICMYNGKLMGNDDKMPKFPPKTCIIGNQSDCHVSFEREPPCKEYSHSTTRAMKRENLADNKQTTLKHSELSKIISTTESRTSRNSRDDYSAEKILSPDRKLSMFSKEIWTEKVIPIDTFVSPEPEIIEIYFDKKKPIDQVKGFGEYGTESIDVSVTRRGSTRGVLARSTLINHRLSAKKGGPSLPGHRMINFDDEIWPVCPKLIPSEEELSTIILENRHATIPPEKLNKNSEDTFAITHPQYSSSKVTSFSALSSMSNTKQYDASKIDIEDNSRSEKMIEPTHEIEGHNEIPLKPETRKFSDTNHSPSALLPSKFTVLDKARKLNSSDGIFREASPVIDVFDQTERNKPSNADSLGTPGIGQRVAQAGNSKPELKEIFESKKKKTCRKNLLSVSSSEPVSTVLEGIPNRNEIHSSYETKLATISCNEIISLTHMQVKRGTRDHGSSFQACPTVEIGKQISAASLKNEKFLDDRFEETSFTPTDIEASGEMDELSQSSTLSLRNKMPEMSIELGSKDQETLHHIHWLEDRLRPLSVEPSSKFPAAGLRHIQESIKPQEIEKMGKRVKAVRFATSDRHDDTAFSEKHGKLRENVQSQHISRERSRVHLDVERTSDNQDCISVESFKQEIDQLANQIATQIQIDPASDDAVVTLAKIELIVEANRQTLEKLQQLQPNAPIPLLIPSDAEKSLAKALMRCRTYMQINGYSSDATSTMNNLLTSTVQTLRQLVERQKLTLATHERRCAVPCSQRNSKRSKGALNAVKFGTLQVQSLISDILTLTERIVPKFTEKKSPKKCSVTSNYPHSGVTSYTKHKRANMDDAPAEINHTIFSKESKVTSKGHASRMTQPLDVAKSTAKIVGETDLRKTTVVSGAPSKPVIDSDQQNMQIQGRHDEDRKLESRQFPTTRSTYPKKTGTTDSTKTLKKLFSELLTQRSRTLPRQHNVNDSTNNFRSLASCHNATNNQKLPAWKPGGNNFIQTSMTVIPNNQKVRPPPPSSVNKKKNTKIDQTRDMQPSQRAAATSGTIKHKLKTSEKSIIKPYNTPSLAKIRNFPAKGNHSELLCLNKSKVQVAVEMDEPKARKLRSKSRTRTRAPNNTSRMTVTEIPLEHANNCLPVTGQSASEIEDLSLTKKASSSPKDIIQMLEELIKSSDNESSIPSSSPVQIVARCNVVLEKLNEDIDSAAHLEMDGKLMNQINVALSNEQGDHWTEASSQNLSIRSKSIEEIVEKSENTVEIADNDIHVVEKRSSFQDIVLEACNLHKKPDSISSLSAEEIVTVSRFNSEAISSRSPKEQATPSVSNTGGTGELSSENSIGSVSSKCCQASLTSLASHDISEELSSSQISDMEMAFYSEETQKASHESFDTVDEERVGREDFAQQFQTDQLESENGGAAPKKKIFNKHAKSLEMLKEILSDQGLGIHLLSRAEDELKDRCKYISNKRGFTGRRCLKGANFISPGFSGEPINRMSLPERNLSASLFSKLATLSESESDIERVEAATMTLANDLAMSKTHLLLTAKSVSHCSEDKAVLEKATTVENATQFDVTIKLDVCVGDGAIRDPRTPVITEDLENRETNITPPSKSPSTFGSSSLTYETLAVHASEPYQCKLPEEILEAFTSAAIKATNLYTAVNILRGQMPSENIQTSNSTTNHDFHKMFMHVGAPKPLSPEFNKILLNADRGGSKNAEEFGKTSDIDNSLELPVQLEETKRTPTVKIITPRIRGTVNDDAACSESTKSGGKESAKNRGMDINVTIVREDDEKTKGNKFGSACSLGKIPPSEPAVPPKRSSTEMGAFGTTLERKTVMKEQIIDPNQVPNVENRSCGTDIFRSAKLIQQKGCQSPSSSQQSSMTGRITGAQIETLHFAGRDTAPVARNTVNAGLRDVIEPDPGSLYTNFAGYESPKVQGKVKGSAAGSRIQTLLVENLQRFKADYDPAIYEKGPIDFEDQLLTVLSDDEILISKALPDPNTYASCTPFNDSIVFSDVNNLLNSLLNKVAENYESSIQAEDQARNIHSSQHRRRSKRVRRLRSKKCKVSVKSASPCGREWIVVSREHILSLVYAGICSFVFWCLQLSVHCEV